MSLGRLWSEWDEELPLFEASIELDPAVPERIDKAAWEIARSARTTATIYRSEFDGSEHERPEQTTEQMLSEAEKIEKSWPHKEQAVGSSQQAEQPIPNP